MLKLLLYNKMSKSTKIKTKVNIKLNNVLVHRWSIKFKSEISSTRIISKLKQTLLFTRLIKRY